MAPELHARPSELPAEAGSGTPAPAPPARLRIDVGGAVQGVGFRPFVYRLGRRLGLGGTVLNSGTGVVIEVEGDPARLEGFLARLRRDKPPAAWIASLDVRRLPPAGLAGFRILKSETGQERSAAILPDLALCGACRREIGDPDDRRHGYAFTNCIECGPRFTIVGAIPYDRPNTTMARFEMCAACRGEYDDPENRRFHAQPNACPSCGPRLRYEAAPGRTMPDEAAPSGPLDRAASLLRSGGILALKGIGGFQLLVDARNGEAVRRLRERKHREEKPLAVMFPSLDAALAECVIGAEEAALLSSPAAPIVLLRPNGRGRIAPGVSRSSPYVGAMLPYSPLHQLLLERLRLPVVATSGNRTDEPIAIEDEEARSRLGGIADAFLLHDRPIARPCDDSVARVQGTRLTLLRRARGYAPMPLPVLRPMPRILAVGGHLKNAVAIACGRQVILGQHLGDLDAEEARQAFRRAIDDLCRLHDFQPELVACDLHPDYYPTRFAESLGLPLVRVQHHQAHVAACAADNGIEGGYLGVAWDGTGYGLDGTIWGGEFFLGDGAALRRIARLRPFRLPGGGAAVRDIRRSACGLLHQVGDDLRATRLGLTEQERSVFRTLVDRTLNSPETSSVGRLFDGVAAIAGVCRRSAFEGQAAMSLEAAIGGARGDDAYPAPLREDGDLVELDWRPLIAAVVDDAERVRPAAEIALRFHNALAEWIVAVARRAGSPRVLLSGGVFQNGFLAARACARLEEARFEAFTHRRVPPNDGGLALGQVVLAAQSR